MSGGSRPVSLIKEEWAAFKTALAFFTRVPVKVDRFYPEASLTYLPLVGAFLGGLLYALETVAEPHLSPEIRALVLLLVQYFLANYFHFDGLMDTLDALSATGDRKRRLEILKTPEIGALGFLFGFFFLLGQYLFLKQILTAGRPPAIFFKPLFGRLGLLAGMVFGKPAKPEGLGKIFLSPPAQKRAIPSFLGLFFLLFWFYPRQVLLISVFLLTMVYYFKYRFGGLTGDLLGALCEISELLFLILLI